MESTLDEPTPVKKPLPLPVGNSDWAAVRAGYWSADKTQLIAGLLDRKATVALFTRPRRFGKTFAMNMLQTYFEKTPESNAHLFEGTKVWADPAHRAEQGKYPVISITFKDTKGADWKATKAFMATAIGKEFRRHRAAFSSPDADPDLAEQARTVAAEKAGNETLANSLGMLAEILHAVHKERPVILIDEYDSPINWAATHGFGEEALQFFRNFLSAAMKDGKHCRLGVITGILRVAKEGVLSGLNNIEVWSVFDSDYSDCFGFTEDEVRGLLATYGHPEKIDEAKNWYDGYVFGGTEIYNPWSLLNYANRGFTAEPYWTSTSSNDLVTEALSRLSPEMRDALSAIFEAKESEATVARELGPYGLIQDNEEAIWSLLVHTGYLKVTSGPDANGTATIAFPNRELASVFRNDIIARMKRQPSGQFVGRLTRALSSGDEERFRKALEDFLLSSASYFDTAHEDFFHGLVLGILAVMREEYEVKSNREEGDGRPDIAMKPRPGVTLPGVILEFKTPKVPPRASQKRIEALLAAAAREARDQIDEKRYAEAMERELCERNRQLSTSRPLNLSTVQDAPPRVLRYGVAFLGKRVALAK